ncbi:metallophosphoesterase family protein [Marinobacterium ramblicola]|uniref:metallophosphoesterase family protein n=1 Tax=Marinobacterium ramblicola TaxID=2849041 RepID=UPI001FEA380F|nr:metallophosphoesterase family protein [Marinobacterium ramblicola]
MNNDVLDLGPIDGPILLFDGPYSNLAATRAMREVAERLQIPPEQCICTGDIVAYCGEPSETLELIRDWNLLVVMGNCEESLAQSALDCGCGFEQGSACSLLSDDWYRFSNPEATACKPVGIR